MILSPLQASAMTTPGRAAGSDATGWNISLNACLADLQIRPRSRRLNAFQLAARSRMRFTAGFGERMSCAERIVMVGMAPCSS